MAKFLTQQWLDEAVRLARPLPERAGATARVEYRITRMPEKADDCWFSWVVDNGRLVEATLGPDPDAEFTLAVSYADNRLLQEGELDLNVAFMQGRAKLTGDTAKLMALMPLTASAEYKAIWEQLRDVTEY